MELKINNANADRRIGHDNINKSVKDHTQAELKMLALHGLRSGNPLILECFVNLPSLADLEADNTTGQIAALKTEATKEPTKP